MHVIGNRSQPLNYHVYTNVIYKFYTTTMFQKTTSFIIIQIFIYLYVFIYIVKRCTSMEVIVVHEHRSIAHIPKAMLKSNNTNVNLNNSLNC